MPRVVHLSLEAWIRVAPLYVRDVSGSLSPRLSVFAATLPLPTLDATLPARGAPWTAEPWFWAQNRSGSRQKHDSPSRFEHTASDGEFPVNPMPLSGAVIIPRALSRSTDLRQCHAFFRPAKRCCPGPLVSGYSGLVISSELRCYHNEWRALVVV